MNILFLMQTFINVDETEAMYYSLAKEFVEHGHPVTVIASNEGKETTIVRMEGVVRVLRVRTLPLMNIHPVLKGISNLVLPSLYKKAMSKYLKDSPFDLIITPTPPITLTNLAARLKRKYNARLFLILRDIFPQNAVDLGMLSKRNPYYYIFRSMEKRLYNISDAIGCMSEGNIAYLLKNNSTLHKEKLFLLPNWTFISKNVDISNRFEACKHDLEGKFIVLFGGNLGAPQKVKNVVEMAKIHEDKKDLLFLVIGKGTHRQYLEKLVRKENIHNIKILNHMRRREYESFASIAHVGLISLNEKFTIPNIPSRTLSYYNFKKPVFAIVDKVTDYDKMLKVDKSGFCCRYGDYEGCRELFNRLYDDPKLRHEMGENGYRALVEKYNPHVAYSKIAEILSFS